MIQGSARAEGIASGESRRRQAPTPWGVASETGRLTDVLLSPPTHLAMVPCNAVTRDSLARGLSSCAASAGTQHRALVTRLEAEGSRCHVVPPKPGLSDLAFTRDSVFMTPWGIVELRPSEPHRRGEPAHLAGALRRLGIETLGAVDEGKVEGGDVCLLRPGLVMIGISGERTDEAGARALGRIFERQGWQALYTRIDPRYLHLDTQFSLVSRHRAVACLDSLESGFAETMADLGIELLPATPDEVDRLEANLLSLGGCRVVAPAGGTRINRRLRSLGHDLIEVEIDQFVRCGGGVHCLTMPLARSAPLP
ncbi:MAG TPA: arginine deiminase family protein [Allosphingosinicella sp.]|nr:arginine deiminase family protein [Allosphingosinicella sp.]